MQQPWLQISLLVLSLYMHCPCAVDGTQRGQVYDKICKVTQVCKDHQYYQFVEFLVWSHIKSLNQNVRQLAFLQCKVVSNGVDLFCQQIWLQRDVLQRWFEVDALVVEFKNEIETHCIFSSYSHSVYHLYKITLHFNYVRNKIPINSLASLIIKIICILFVLMVFESSPGA